MAALNLQWARFIGAGERKLHSSWGVPLVVLLVLTVILAGAIGLSQYQGFYRYLGSLKRDQQEMLRHSWQRIHHDMDLVFQDLHMLAASGAMHAWLENGNAEESSRQCLVESFVALVEQRGIYDQARILDNQGQEILRVNYRHGRAVEVPLERLQDKSKRYYFTDAIALGQGEVFVSPLDLNVEHGEIEEPYRPMLRVATPLFDQNKKRVGLLVLNYKAGLMLEKLPSVAGEYLEFMLVNAKGYWLLAGDKSKEWGFMLGHDANFAQEHGELWRLLSLADEGVVRDTSGYWAFKTYYPLGHGIKSSSGSAFPNGASRSVVSAEDYYWKIIVLAPESLIQQEKSALWYWGVILFFNFLSPVLLASWLYMRVRYQRNQAIASVLFNERRFRGMTESLAEALVCLDSEGGVTFMNGEAERLLGWTFEELVGRRLHDFVHVRPEQEGVHAFEKCPIIAAMHAQTHLHTSDEIFVNKSGKKFPISLTVSPMAEIGYGESVVLSFQDITKIKQLQNLLAHQASHDALTDIYNRGEIEERLRMLVTGYYEVGKGFCLIVADLDFFKKINDTFGHQAGDEVLRQATKRIQSCIRRTDMLGRYGGEEFLVLLPGVRGQEAVATAERIRAVFEDVPFALLAGQKVTVTLSLGVACMEHGLDGHVLVQVADQALYRAKKEGRNRVVFSPSDGV